MNCHNLFKVSTLALTALLLGGCISTRVAPTSTPIKKIATVVTRASPTPSPTPPIATVVARDGKAYKVTNLTAKYVAGGMWTGSRPTRTYERLKIVLTIVKDRVTTTEEIDIPFASMRRLMFKGVSVPENLKAAFGKQEPIRIEMRDGSFKLLSGTLLVEVSAEGAETKRVTVTSYSFKAGETQGQAITLNGFSGRVETEDGKVGDFFISTSDTMRIEFE